MTVAGTYKFLAYGYWVGEGGGREGVTRLPEISIDGFLNGTGLEY